MNLTFKKYKNIMSVIVIFSLIIQPFSLFKENYVKKVDAFSILGTGPNVDFPNLVQNTINTVTETSEARQGFIGQILQGVAKSLMKKMTESTITWINNGFEGNPLFLENPSAFFTDFKNQELDALAGVIGYDQYNYPFGRDFAQNLILSVQNKFERNAQFTLQSVVGQQHWSTFVNNDFGAGGWNGYLALSEPANNPYGFTLLASEEFYRRTRGTDISEAEQVRQDLEQAGGILTPRVCVAGTNGYEGSWSTAEFQNANASRARASRAGDQNAVARIARSIEAHTCTEDKKIATTPGVAITAQLTNSLGSGWRQSELATAFGTNLSAIIDATLNKLANDGLTALSKKISGTSSSTTAQPTPHIDGLVSDAGSQDNPSTSISSADIVVNLEEFLITGERGSLVDPNDDPQTGARFPNGPTAIELTQRELTALRSIVSILEATPEKVYALDVCLPGPDYGWEERFKEKVSRVEQKIQRKLVRAKRDKKVRSLESSLDKLYRMEDENIWKIKTVFFSFNIPSAVTIDDEIKRVRSLTVDATVYKDRIFEKTATLARLNSLRLNYESAQDEETRNNLAVRYREIQASVSTESSLRQTQNLLESLGEDYLNLDALNIRCQEEKEELGFSESGSISFDGTDTEDLPEPFTDIDLTEATEEIGDSINIVSVSSALEDGGTILTSEEELELSDYSINELIIFYALVEQKDQTVQEAIAVMEAGLPEDIYLPKSFSSEIFYYCQGINTELYDSLQGTNPFVYVATGPVGVVAALFGAGDIDADIDCNSFYRSSIWDYRVDEGYTGI